MCRNLTVYGHCKPAGRRPLAINSDAKYLHLYILSEVRAVACRLGWHEAG